MVGGVQPKLLLTQDENNILILDEDFSRTFKKNEEHRYKLVRERDQLIKISLDIKWVEWDESGKYLADYKEILVGRSLIMSPFNMSFTWQTTNVIEIIEQKEGYVKFKTENSNYELFKI